MSTGAQRIQEHESPPGFFDLVTAVGDGTERVRAEFIETWDAWSPAVDVLGQRAVEAYDVAKACVVDLLLINHPPIHSRAALYLSARAATFLLLSGLMLAGVTLSVTLRSTFALVLGVGESLAGWRHQRNERHRFTEAAASPAPAPGEEIVLGEAPPEISRAQRNHLAAQRWIEKSPGCFEGLIRDSRGKPTRATLIWDRHRRRYEVQLPTLVTSRGFMRRSNYQPCFSRGRLNYHVEALPQAAQRDPARIVASLSVFAEREERRARKNATGREGE